MKKIFLALVFCNLVCITAFSQEAAKIDEFEYTNCEEYLARVDNLISHSMSNPTTKVYVFIYEGKTGEYDYRNQKIRYSFPAFGLAKARIASMKKYISGFRGYSIDNFVFVNAGFLERAKVEFWDVPVGIAPPKPSPTLTKIKYRRGRPIGFCIGCCE